MIDSKNPLEIAREAFKQLATLRLAPTPANYQACYNEIAKLPNVAGFPEVQLRRIASALPLTNPKQEAQHAQFQAAIGRRSWQEVQQSLVALAVGEADSPAAPVADDRPSEPVNGLLAGLRRLIEDLLPALGEQDGGVSGQARELLEVIKGAPMDIPDLLLRLARFSRRVSLAAEEQGEIRQTLLKLLHLIIDNIGELIIDEQCVQGQIDALVSAVAPPLSLRRLDDVERRLQDVIVRQRLARGRCQEAQEEMRRMLASFIDHLSLMNQSSTAFAGDLEESARQIAEVRTFEELAPLMKKVIEATHAMAEDSGRSRDQLADLQVRVQAADSELARLHEELHHASASARNDPLTDTLNRRGLDEALAREIAGMRRKGAPLALSLLDIDNFKKLNDRLGHATGDEALLHLVQVVRQYMRPIDTLARYGGEEFVILMPDTALAEGIEAMKRLQRELTRNFFLSGNEKILITFSAGVAELTPGESGDQAIERADQAMYLAKRAGKNRVMGG